MLLIPNSGLIEQTYNAIYVKKNGLGIVEFSGKVSEKGLDHFLSSHTKLVKNFSKIPPRLFSKYSALDIIKQVITNKRSQEKKTCDVC